MSRVMEVTSYELLDPGRYPATIGEITDEEGNFGLQFKLRFDLAGEHEGQSLHAWCSQKLSQKSKLYQWVVGITGRAPQPGESFDIDSLLGRKVIINISVETKKDGSGMEFNRVTAIKGARPAQEQPPQQLPVEMPPPPARSDDDYVEDWMQV